MIGSQQSPIKFRLYEPEDHDQVVAIFKKQNINPPVNLPMPEKDPATAIVIVGELDGVIKRAILLRATMEVHYVTDPSDIQGDDLRRMTFITEGAVMQLNAALSDLNRAAEKMGMRARYPLFMDVFARVPVKMPKMIEFMKRHLRFIKETPHFKTLWHWVGK